MIEPSSPVPKVWKSELYKFQIEAPTPKPLQRSNKLSFAPSFYGSEYQGEMGHLEAEELLHDRPDGTYIIRKSPKSQEFYTLSVRFDYKTKHYKVYFKPPKGYFLREQSKLYDSIYDLVADGLVNFYMQLHAAPIINEINQQTRNCYQRSPYMTLNRRKLRALSNELRKSIKSHCYAEAAAATAGNKQSLQDEIGMKNTAIITPISKTRKSSSSAVLPSAPSSSSDDVDILPVIYKKSHTFKVHNFKGLNWCEFCANFLWGFTAQGVKCEACGFMAHFKCSELVPAKCVPDLKRIRGVFGTDLTTVVQLYQCAIPFVVRRCVEEVEARGMLQEGIYRVSGFADEIEALKLALDREGEKTDMSELAYGNINVIAGTLKLYLRLLPVPLITFQAYPGFMQATKCPNVAEEVSKMLEAVKALPLAHFRCLKFMVYHLKKVASHYAANKMNEHNLATVFAPTLIATPQHMTNLTEEIFMLSSLITHCEQIFER